MKIIYSAGNRLGAGHQLTDILPHLSNHQIKIAAYTDQVPNIRYLDWTLDALHCSSKERNVIAQIFGYAAMPAVASTEAEYLVQDVRDYKPDLIISDGEPLLAHIANILEIPLWYCSSLHLMDGFEWKNRQQRIYGSQLDDTRRILRRFPGASKILVYSEFGNLDLPLRSEYNWITPYSNIDRTLLNNSQDYLHLTISDQNRLKQVSKIVLGINNKSMLHKGYSDAGYLPALINSKIVLNSAHTRLITDGLLAGKPIITIPDLRDPETMLNSILLEFLGLGKDVGQLELMELAGVEELEKAIEVAEKIVTRPIEKKHPYLHELINLFGETK